MGNDMAIDNITSQTTEFAAATAPEFKFASAEIMGASSKFIHLFESAKAMEMPVGMGTLATLATAMATTSPTLTAAVGIGAAINGMVKGSKSPTR